MWDEIEFQESTEYAVAGEFDACEAAVAEISDDGELGVV